MKVNRLNWLRVIRVLKSVDMNEAKFEIDGSFGVSSEDNACLLFGKSLPLGQTIGCMDLPMLEKMLVALPELEINVEIENGVMKLSGEKTVFGYRLGQVDLIDGESQEKIKELEAGGLSGGEISYEDLVRIGSLIKTLGVEKVAFRSEEGQLVVQVGDRKLFYGEIRLAGVTLTRESVFVADRLRKIVDAVDSGKVGLFFRSGEKGLLKIQTQDWVWYVGELVG